MIGGRPPRLHAALAVLRFLRASGYNYKDLLRHDGVWLRIVEDGVDGWAFWLHPYDTTSYVHPSLYVEWCGTCAEECTCIDDGVWGDDDRCPEHGCPARAVLG